MDVEVAIIGGGLVGLATAWRAALRGRSVAVFDRSPHGHAGGSSHGATRLFRAAYDAPLYAQLALEARAFWNELDPTLRTITGGLDLGPPRTLRPVADAMAAAGASYTWLSPDEMVEQLPWLAKRTHPGIWSPDTAVINAARTIDALRDAAASAGATVVREASVAVASFDDSGVTLRAGDESVRARRCVIAAGAWAGPLLEQIGAPAPLVVSEQEVSFYEAPMVDASVIDRSGPFLYAVPAAFGAPGMKAGEHGGGRLVSPDARSTEPHAEAIAKTHAWVEATFDAALGAHVATESCLYTLTPDEDFIIDTEGPFVIGSACSGHGFKFGPLMGEILARLALDEDPVYPLSRFARARFPGLGRFPG